MGAGQRAESAILIVFVIANTVLAKPIFGPCALLFEVPFTNKSFELPLWMWRWMWGWVPLCTLALFTAHKLGNPAFPVET